MQQTTLTIAIPTKNRPQDLLVAMNSIIMQTSQPDAIVIVDQSRDSESRTAVEAICTHYPHLNLHYVLDSSISGTAAAKNYAARLATSDLLVFIDDDIVLDKECLAAIVRAHEQYQLEGVGGIAIPHLPRSAIYDFASLLFHLGPFRDERLLVQQGLKRIDKPYPTRILSTCLASFTRSIFDEYQFDETLTGYSLGEDIDFCYRASQKHGFAIVPSVQALHSLSKENRLGLRDLYKAKSRFYSFFFHKNVPRTSINFAAYLWLNVGLVFDAVVKSINKHSAAPLLGLIEGWRNAISIPTSRTVNTVLAR